MADNETGGGMESIAAMIAAMTKADRDAAATARATLLPKLRAAGCTSVEVEYDGYGDSGNVENVSFMPENLTLPQTLHQQVSDFGWQFAYSRHPGFENNDGGFGTLIWDVAKDSISLSHNDRYTAYETTDEDDL